MAEGSRTRKSVADSKVRVKKEDDSDSRDEHSHQFNVRFNPRDQKEYTIYCNQPRTVLEAIKSNKKYQELKCADENIIIQLGKADKECAIPTHFPCSWIKDGELLIMHKSKEVVEAQNKPETVHPRHRYSVFYIDKEGGINTETKKRFRSKKIKKFKYVCVYGEKGMTVEEALKRDGRFIDDLGDFTLSDNENPAVLTEHTQQVDSLDEKEFKLCLERKKQINEKDEKLQEKPHTSNSSQHQNDSASVLAAAQKRGTSVKTLVDKSNTDDKTAEIYEILRRQFPDLRKLMEDRFPGKSYQEAVNLKREDFGKIQQSFSEIHRVEDLIKLGKSVCKVLVGNVCMGTGFVLFDHYIMTNAHLFKGCVKEDGKNLQEEINVFALFNYDRPEPHTDYHWFSVKKTLIDFIYGELDYAVLELNPEGQKVNQTTKTVKVPAGLLKKFGPVPSNGEACIIGHPKGEVKQMDPTCIIEKENRGHAIDHHLEQYRNTCFTIQSISQLIRNQGIENILIGGDKADKGVTYNTFMYHGSSGSPVFDAHCRVFGLHSRGFVYGFPETESVIEFAQPLLAIIKSLVTNLKESGKGELLKRVYKEAKGSSFLREVLKIEPEDPTDTQ